MKRIAHLLHHRSLTVSVIALLFGMYAVAFLPEHSYRIHEQGPTFLLQAGIAAAFGLLYCAFTLVILLRDNRSGYPSFRCSLAGPLRAFRFCFLLWLWSVRFRDEMSRNVSY